MQDIIKIFRNNAAIDATILTKDMVVDGVTRYSGLSLDKIAAIDDEMLGLPLLTTPGLGMIGCPANAQQEVIEAVRAHKGYVSPERIFRGFMDFYERAGQRGIRLIISDKDGVLKEGSNSQWGSEFRELALEMGQEGKPYVVVLTGSSQQQNRSFIREYGLDEKLGSNEHIRNYPYLLLLENGAIHLNVLTGETRNYVADISPGLLELLKGDFEGEVRKRIEKEVLPSFRFEWSSDPEDQRGKVYHVQDKQSMVTINVPREHSDGTPYRKSENADLFRDEIVKIMEEVAKSISLHYKVIR